MYRIVETYQGHIVYTHSKAHDTLAQAAQRLRAQVADGRLRRSLAIMRSGQFVPRTEWWK